MTAAFVTSTGTGIGKTFVASGLIHCFRESGQRADALKPVVSGFDPASPSGSDPAVLLEALGREVTPEEIERVSPWRFRAPLSPDMAARAEHSQIDFRAVTQFCRTAIVKNTGALVIEGIGGIMVPLDERHTILDLMLALRLPVVLVGGSYLGTLSHVLSAQDVLLRHAVDLRAIVISESEDNPPPFDATLTTLSHFAKVPLLGLRRQDPMGQNGAAFQRLTKLIA